CCSACVSSVLPSPFAPKSRTDVMTYPSPRRLHRAREVHDCSPVLSRILLIPMSEVSRILDALRMGDPRAANQLLPLVYEELRRLAAQQWAREAPGQTLQPTALVHEAYLRLMGDPKPEAGETGPHWDGRGHFFAAAAEAMRRILVENARGK